MEFIKHSSCEIFIELLSDWWSTCALLEVISIAFPCCSVSWMNSRHRITAITTSLTIASVWTNYDLYCSVNGTAAGECASSWMLMERSDQSQSGSGRRGGETRVIITSRFFNLSFSPSAYLINLIQSRPAAASISLYSFFFGANCSQLPPLRGCRWGAAAAAGISTSRPGG